VRSMPSIPAIGMIAAKEQHVVIRQPAFELYKSAAALPGLHFGNQRRFVTAANVDVDVVTFVLIAGRTRKRDPFGVDADCLVEIDDLPLDPIAFAPVPRAAIPMCAIFGGISRARAITVSIAPLSS
jgi:hypothetical protein